jgi:hypothetical protein
MRRVVWLLGVVATLAVAASATVAATVSPTPDRQWLRAQGLAVELPTEGWRLEPQTSAVRYDDSAVVRGPAVLDAGFCPSAPSSSRAFVGFLAPVRGELSGVLTAQLGTWVAAIGGAAVPVPAVAGPRADFDVPVPAGPCAPTTAHLTLVARETSLGVVVLVLVRDVGEPGDLTPAEAERIVASLG